MKKILFFILASLVFNIACITNINAQDDRLDDFEFENEEIDASAGYFSLGLGVTGNLLFMNYDDINSKYLAPKSLKDFDGPLFPLGIEFFTALPHNLRLGVTYQNVSKLRDAEAAMEDTEAKLKYTSELSNNMTGVIFSYALLPFSSFAVAPGIGLNFGKMTLNNFTSPTSVEFGETTNYYNEQIKYSYWAVEPQLNIEYAVTSLLMLRLGVSYLIDFDNPFADNAWSINGGNAYNNVPSTMMPQGLNVKFGVFIGLFNY